MKQALRQEYRKKRDALSPEVRHSADKKIFQTLLDLPAFQKADTVMPYVSFRSEPDTHKLIQYCLQQGKNVCVPVVVKATNQLFASYIQSFHDLTEGSYGILEPAKPHPYPLKEIDLIIVPGLVFDKKRFRIGYGAGYYDRLLRDYQGYTIGICYDTCIVENIFPDALDIAVKQVISEERVF